MYIYISTIYIVHITIYIVYTHTHIHTQNQSQHIKNRYDIIYEHKIKNLSFRNKIYKRYLKTR
jgi:hypothetical protein